MHQLAQPQPTLRALGQGAHGRHDVRSILHRLEGRSTALTGLRIGLTGQDEAQAGALKGPVRTGPVERERLTPCIERDEERAVAEDRRREGGRGRT